MTVQDIINDVRAKVGDTISPYQWLDAHFYTPINNGIRAIANNSPHALYVTTITTSLPTDVTATTDTVLIIPYFRNALVEIVIAQLMQEDKNMAVQQQSPKEEPAP